VTTNLQVALDQALDALRAELGDNLYSCCVYGSAVRGNSIEGISDINLLVILNQSSSEAHQAIARAIGASGKIDPFILGRSGFERSARAFATKFASIKRNYRVLHGADPLADFGIDAALEKFLCEQALRNLRLRLIYSFVTRQRHQAYDKFIIQNITGLFVQLSEALRLQGLEVPTAFEARVPLLEREFKINGQVVRDLLALKKSPVKFTDADTIAWHTKLFPLVDTVLHWIEANWPTK
jgi:hypothetical protein